MAPTVLLFNGMSTPVPCGAKAHATESRLASVKVWTLIMEFLPWRAVLETRCVCRSAMQASLQFLFVSPMPCTGLPAVFVRCPINYAAAEQEYAAAGSPLSAPDAITVAAIRAGGPERVHRMFLGQLRRNATVAMVEWLVNYVFDAPRGALLCVENHRNASTGRGKGCAWPTIADEPTVLAMLAAQHRLFYDRVNGAEGVWLVPAGAEDALRAETDIRNQSRHHLPHMPRSAIVAEIPHKATAATAAIPPPATRSPAPLATPEFASQGVWLAAASAPTAVYHPPTPAAAHLTPTSTPAYHHPAGHRGGSRRSSGSVSPGTMAMADFATFATPSEQSFGVPAEAQDMPSRGSPCPFAWSSRPGVSSVGYGAFPDPQPIHHPQPPRTRIASQSLPPGSYQSGTLENSAQDVTSPTSFRLWSPGTSFHSGPMPSPTTNNAVPHTRYGRPAPLSARVRPQSVMSVATYEEDPDTAGARYTPVFAAAATTSPKIVTERPNSGRTWRHDPYAL